MKVTRVDGVDMGGRGSKRLRPDLRRECGIESSLPEANCPGVHTIDSHPT